MTTFTATVVPVNPGSGTPTGTVTFMDGSTTLGTATLGIDGQALFTASSLAAGGHSITASYSGDINFATSVSNSLSDTVNQASTTTSVIASTNPSVYGQSVTFTATVVPMNPGSGTPTGTVTFMDGSTALGTATLETGGQASLSTSSLALGSHSITASYSGDADFITSAASALSVSVSPPILMINGTGTTQAQDDQTSNLFDNGTVQATISDNYSEDALTITITQQLSGGGTDNSQVDGSLISSDGFSSFVDSGNGTYTLTVTASDATNELQKLEFRPTVGVVEQTVDTIFQIEVADRFAPLNTVTNSNTLVEVETIPPTITGANNLSSLNQGQTNSGNTVASLVSGFTTGANGIAIRSVNNGSQSGGTWKYSVNGGGSWTAIPTIPNGKVFVLQNTTDMVQFVPNSSYSGSPASITFYAWDGNGTDASLITSGGADFSSNTETSSITFYAGPGTAQTGGGGAQLISDSQTTNPFDNSANEASIIEGNSSDLLNITVTQELTNGGTTDGSQSRGKLAGGGFNDKSDGTYTLTGVTAAQANSALAALVFTPVTGTAGATVKTFFVLNATDAYSQSTTPLSSEVDVKSPPQLNGSGNYNAIAANASNPLGIEVVNLISGQTVDSTDSSLGIAISAVDSANGTWQYSTDGTHRNNISPGADQVSGTNAFLLDSANQVRFVPSTGYVGTATITFLAWDGTFGTYHHNYNPTQSTSLTAFSVDSADPTDTAVTAKHMSATRESLLSQLFAEFGESFSDEMDEPSIARSSSPFVADRAGSGPTDVSQNSSRTIFETLGLDLTGAASSSNRHVRGDGTLASHASINDWSDEFLYAVSAVHDSSTDAD